MKPFLVSAQLITNITFDNVQNLQFYLVLCYMLSTLRHFMYEFTKETDIDTVSVT
jgi:hypothetical protein